jgi:MerR family transcriptional regulator, light-induced transcriptional regulator
MVKGEPGRSYNELPAMRKAEQYAAELTANASKLVEETVAKLYKRHPQMKARYGAAGLQRCREDIAYHYSTLTEAVFAADSNIFLKYVGWGKSVLVNRKVSADHLIDCLLMMQDVIERQIGGAASEAANEQVGLALETFDSFADMPPSCIDPSSSLANLTNSYLEALLSSDREQARKVLQSAERMGLGLGEIYQHVFQPAQREIGRLWQVNHISVAQEHYCTATTEMLMSEVHAQRRPQAQDGRLFVGACVAGEQHSIGVRMVSEVMEAKGWRAYCTGANTPTASLLDMVRRMHVHVLGISCATALHLTAVRQLLAAVRDLGRPTRLMVGGRMFCEFPGLWKKVGADGFAEDAESAVRVAAKLVGSKQPATSYA